MRILYTIMMRKSLSFWHWLLLAIVIVCLLSLLALWSWGTFARSAYGDNATTLPTHANATALDRLIQPLLDAQKPTASGVALLEDGVDAFIARGRSARLAERSLDIQYYIWRHDTTGRLLEREIMRAAERGVRVRLLLDDYSVAGRDDEFLAMDAHPNVEIRLFNPARNRTGVFRRATEMALRFISFNRRMHNKAWIADNRMAVVGGRNIGDEYFGASDTTNYRDTDFLLLGPAVAQSSRIFDHFWNAQEVIPLQALHAKGSRWSAEEFHARQQAWLHDHAAQPWLEAMRARERLIDEMGSDSLTFHWSSRIRVVSDPPSKASARASQRNVADWLLYDISALLFSAQHDTWMISPYFVPGEGGTLLLTGQVRRGRRVRVLTNSLAATDVALVHAGYTKYRSRLLASGVKLYELKPDHAASQQKFRGSSGASLHSKAFVVDNARGFLGSFNLDPRSVQLNTEMGVLFEDEAIAAELTDFFERSIQHRAAWELSLQAKDGGLRWHGSDEETFTQEPHTRWWQRWLVRGLGWLPIESQL